MKTFTDVRGSIYDFENGIQVITCNNGSKRANHFHRSSGHKTILTRGSMDYYERASNTDQSIVKQSFQAPYIFDTGPLVDHLMHFTSDSEFVCLRTGGSENHEKYEEDLVRLNYDMQEAYDKQLAS